MNKRLIKRELANLKMLFDIAKTQGFSVFFWSLADGLCRRLHFDSLYHRTHYNRHEACKAYLKKNYCVPDVEDEIRLKTVLPDCIMIMNKTVSFLNEIYGIPQQMLNGVINFELKPIDNQD